MRIHLLAAFCLIVPCVAAASAQAAESRLNGFTLPCNGSQQTVAFTAGGLGNSATRLISGAQVAISQPQDGIRSLRLQVADDPNNTLLLMGNGEISGRNNLAAFLQTTTSATGTVSFQIIASCIGGGPLRGLASVYFF
jgi:hypothetical protein